ncbi:hypothetical protein Rhe02_60190 [Rhizocola hellebori]|uniref:Uncharacterized protein n=1 Tax=Rhizocola hellebori TaxID=1392758 RepID=A0A8J3QDB8_9ACTN|nr:hypothetical protein [Rhizocola hellebori]GIH07952.1 hypothetical protein Rhe02_60190 [Rhizocola hellebori]
MTSRLPGALPLIDDRHFNLIRWELGHHWMLLRGGREFRDPPADPGPSLELLFTNVQRICLSTGWDSLALRVSTDEERSQMEAHLGQRIWFENHLFFLKEGSPDHYVIAGGLYWAEIDHHSHFTLWDQNRDPEGPKPIGDVYYSYDAPEIVAARRAAWKHARDTEN